MLFSPSNKGVALSILMAALLSVTLAACGKGDDKAATQVAAKVNKNEISVHQINNVLARAGNITPEQAKIAGKQVLEKLIDQDLLVQQAMETKLDRDPNTMQAIEAAKRELLSRAYLEKLAANLAKPTPDELKDFYGKHPELFAERRVYNFRELAVQASPDLKAKLQEQMSKAKSLEEIAEWLKSQNIAFSANVSTKAAEQLPLELLPRFHQMKDGQIGVLPSGDGLVILQLAASRNVPLDMKAATPFIEQFLMNQRRNEMVEKEVKQLREKAKIEYRGEFATAKADEKAKDGAKEGAKESAKEGAKPAVAEKPAAPAAVKSDTSMDKGISGLK